jgi:hypothetical protein
MMRLHRQTRCTDSATSTIATFWAVDGTENPTGQDAIDAVV